MMDNVDTESSGTFTGFWPSKVQKFRCTIALAKAHRGGVCARCIAEDIVTTDSNHGKPVAQNLLDRRFDGWAPNRAWTTDISYVLTEEGWLYLAAIVDLGTRRIVGWAMREQMSAKLACDALQMAYWRRWPAAGLLMHATMESVF